MAHFAHVVNGVVTDIIVADQEFIDSGSVGDPAQWVQTSYNTKNGIHYGPDGEPDGGVALRKNFAGIGFTYDVTLDAFIPPKTFPSWVLNTEKCSWEPPTPMPTDGKDYGWNEETVSWVELEPKP